MATLQEMKQELETAVQDKSLLNNIQAELAKMETTEGLDGKPILEKFYKLWKDSGGKKGQRNEINSWTAFALGMTEKKPEDGSTFLQKRRAFARKGFPDIDSDFDYEHRDDIYKYIIDTYGREHVGNIGTYSGLKMKSFVRRAVKAIDPERTFFKGFDEWKTATNALGEDILTALPPQYGAFLKVKGPDGQEHAIKTVEDATKWCKNFAFYINKYPAILEHSRNIEGLLSTFGVHAAGIVISSEPLGRIAPLRQTKMLSTDEFQTGPKYAYATQFEYNDLEFLGLIKFDILALSTLSVIRRCCQEVEKNYPGIKIDIENLPLDDAKTFKLYKSGKLTGVFQCEEHGMQRTMVNMGVDSIDDIMAGIALYRPGPMDSIPTYCARKHGSETLDYFHPSLKKFIEPYVKKTYGLLVYQEQVMTICNSIAGFSIPEGYVVIKAIGKKQRDLLQKYREKFISGAEKNGIQGKIAADYWDKVITPFADYGFNKAHACCYAYNSYITAYLKANYPEEFVTAYLNVEVGRSNYDKVSVLEKMAEDMNIDIAPRHINDCKLEYRIIARADAAQGIGKSQICPSVKCKGLSDNAAHEIVSKQPYSSLADFAAKTDTKIVDMRAVEALVEAGFFRPKTGRGRGKDAIIAEFEVIREDLKKAKKRGVETGNIFA
jgi:DNA polymerase-3 subunit alpha